MFSCFLEGRLGSGWRGTNVLTGTALSSSHSFLPLAGVQMGWEALFATRVRRTPWEEWSLRMEEAGIPALWGPPCWPQTVSGERTNFYFKPLYVVSL